MGNTNEKSAKEFLDDLKQTDQTTAQAEKELNDLRIHNIEKIEQLKGVKAADKKLRKITAAEARAIVESSNATLKHIYKNIEEEAKENRISILWSFYGQDEGMISKVTETLKADGYTITNVDVPEDSEDILIKISW